MDKPVNFDEYKEQMENAVCFATDSNRRLVAVGFPTEWVNKDTISLAMPYVGTALRDGSVVSVTLMSNIKSYPIPLSQQVFHYETNVIKGTAFTVEYPMFKVTQ